MTLDEARMAELKEFLPKCVEKRGERYYPTEAGCIRLTEWLAERGLNARVSIGDDLRFVIDSEDSEPEGR